MTGSAVSRPVPRTSGADLVLAGVCLAVYGVFCLQQLVVGHGFGGGMSLGATAMRVFAVGLSAWMLWRRGVPSVLRPVLVAVLACGLALAASVVASGHRDIAVRFAVRYGTELLLLWSLVNLGLAYSRFVPAAAWAAVAMLWANVLVALAERLGWQPAMVFSLAFHPPETFKYLPRVGGIYEHPALLGASAVITALLAVQMGQHRALGRGTVGWAVAGAAVAVVLGGERNPLVPLFLLAGVSLWPRWSDGLGVSRRAIWVLLSGMLVLVAAMVWRRYGELASASSHGESFLTSFSLGRTYIWLGALRAWWSHPWFGLGAGVFQFLTPDFTGGRFDRGELHAHNLILGILSETGLVGLLACGCLVYALWRPLLEVRGHDRRRVIWAWTWLLVLSGFGLFDFYLPFYSFAIHASLAVAAQYSLTAIRDAGQASEGDGETGAACLRGDRP